MTYVATITEEMIVDMLTDTDLTHREMGEKYGVHFATVAKIRSGNARADVRPDIPRWGKKRSINARTCWKCQHHRVYYKERAGGRPSTQAAVACGLGLPDPIVHGARFATQCSAFLPE